MKTTAEKIAVMQAFERGEKIESANIGIKHFEPIVGNPLWNWYAMDYRVAPKLLECWALVGTDGNVVGTRMSKVEAEAVPLPSTCRVVHMREVTP